MSLKKKSKAKSQKKSSQKSSKKKNSKKSFKKSAKKIALSRKKLKSKTSSRSIKNKSKNLPKIKKSANLAIKNSVSASFKKASPQISPFKPSAEEVAKKKSRYPNPIMPVPFRGTQPMKVGILVGEVEDYYSHVGVIAVTLKEPLAVGDIIHVKGHTSDFTQKIDSLQLEHKSISRANKGDDIGIHVNDKARKGDKVFKL